AFGTDNFGTAAHVAELKHLAPSLQKLERDFEASIIKNMTTSIRQALELKAEAAAEHRILRLSRTSLLLAARLARQEGRTAVFPGVLGPSESRRAEARLLRYRKFTVLVAVDPSDNQVVGTVSLTLAQAEALLPPPFPSFAPFRPYVANMAVRKSHRRQGVARALLRAAARVAKRWGAEAVWLHVQHRREAALGLYLSEGFQPAPPAPGPFQLPTLKALTGELLLRKVLKRHASAARAGQLSGPAQRVALGMGVGSGGELQEQGQGQGQGEGQWLADAGDKHSPDTSTHHDHNPSLSPSPSLTLGPSSDPHPNHSPASSSTHPWTAPTQPSSKHTLTPPHQAPDQPPSPSGVRVLVAVDGSTQGVAVDVGRVRGPRPVQRSLAKSRFAECDSPG
ncbi:hypothetical protein QJQ45_019400, partial [Haematococcus lacustris]